jgi:cellulose synthase/poly-beta-1,6-N-acetylglucosamine synthase-like glycosyltransferase
MEIVVLNNILFWELMFFVLMNVIWIGIYFKFRGRGGVTNELKDQPSASVIIPVFNKVKHVKEAINSALALDYKNKNVIVVNDGSTDGSEAICRNFEKKGLIKFINFKKNRGKSYALNAGIRASNSDFILTMDADSFVERGALGKMIRHFGNPKLGAVAGVVKVRNNRGILQRLQFIEYFQQSFQRLVQGFFHSVLVLPGPISLYRKEAIVKSGYFENTTLAEDWDMTMKVHKSGYGVVSEEGAYADTYALDTPKGWWRQRARWSRGGIQIARKHKDSLTKIDNRVMKRFIFPIHLIWIIIPVIAMPLAVLLLLPSSAAFAAFITSMGTFFSSLFGWVFAGIQTSIVGLYSMIDIAVFKFVEFNNFGMLRVVATLTGLAFLAFTYVSIKTFNKDFTPKSFFALLFMPIYWVMLNIVFLYSLAAEALKRKATW